MEIGTIGEHDQLLLEAAPKTKKRKKPNLVPGRSTSSVYLTKSLCVRSCVVITAILANVFRRWHKLNIPKSLYLEEKVCKVNDQ